MYESKQHLTHITKFVFLYKSFIQNNKKSISFSKPTAVIKHRCRRS